MSKSEFAITRDLFTAYTGYNKPLSFAEWLEVADDCKAAVLYCQFYEQITLAWYKLVSVYSSDADGVAEVLQYLQKNVQTIKDDPKRFSPSYIYKVAYNCLYCLCRDPNRYKAIYENEMSNLVPGPDGDYLDLFDTVANVNIFDDARVNEAKAAIWKLVDEEINRRESIQPGSGKDFAIVVSELIGDRQDFTGYYHSFDFKPADDVEYKVYKKSEETSLSNAVARAEAIKAKYGADLQSDIVATVKERNGKQFVKLEYSVKEERTYKGAQNFTERECNSVDDEVRASIISVLEVMLQPYKAILCESL